MPDNLGNRKTVGDILKEARLGQQLHEMVA